MPKFTQEAREFIARIIDVRRQKTPIKQERFTFRSRALPDETFFVLSFEGWEELSTLYSFTINLVSKQADLDIDKILSMPVIFIIQDPDGKHVPFQGMLAEFQQLHESHGLYFFRAVMVPKLWWLTQTSHNQVFLRQTAPEIVESVLKDGGLSSMEYEIRLKENYTRVYEYVCQYQETHYNFLCRWLEREGMYYFFEITSTGEKVIITDTKEGHSYLPQGDAVAYSPVSGLEQAHVGETVTSFNLIQKRLPETILLKNYDYNRPSLDLSVQARVDVAGLGRVYVYGDDYRTFEEGERLARIRKEAFTCRQKIYRGEGSAAFLRPGFLFNLKNHFREEFNRAYLAVSVNHEGDQTALILAGLAETQKKTEKNPFYKNSFSAIPSDVQYRDGRKAERPRIHGSIHAHIDAAGSGEYAELDDQGRYKVILPFDLSGRGWGKASTWLRQVQPYGGSDHGFHFPLHKGTEVLLTFIDGDPDRPVIAGVVPNPLTPSPVRNSNQTKNLVHTAGGNILELEDLAGQQRLLLSPPRANNRLHLGAPPLTRAVVNAEGDGNDQQTIEPPPEPVDLRTELSASFSIGEFFKTELGGKATPGSTQILEQAAASPTATPPVPATPQDAGPPATGDYYLTTAGSYVQNTGADYYSKTVGKKLEMVVGSNSLTVGGSSGLAVKGPALQTCGSTRTILAEDSRKQVGKKDVREDVPGDKAVTITR
ncbi:MAG: type VI secretion system tip protein VgrG [Deltaproteobacteria bacterium]|nr:type VI secretion system tip protein VgrG [Deltaproteobacteria bacterium]